MAAPVRSPGPLSVLRAPVAALSGLLLFGTCGFVAIEGWSPLDGLFMSVITLTTIGYGEVHPLSAAGRLFTIAYIIGGIGVTTLSLTQLAHYVAEGGLGSWLRARQEDRRMKALHDHVVVVGYGRLGREIVADLVHDGVEVVVIDLVEPQGLPEGVHCVVGDATQDETLREASLGTAKGLAVATPSDALNVYITFSARQLYPALPIQTRVEDESAVVKARRAGANGVVRPYHLGGARMTQALERPGATAFLEAASERRRERLHLQEIVAGPGSPLLGRLADLALPVKSGVSVVALQRPGSVELDFPRGDTLVGVGDRLVLFGPPDRLQALMVSLAPGSDPGGVR